MNSRPWPTSQQISPVNTDVLTQQELQQALATLNNLIAQFNALQQTSGNLKLQIEAMMKQLRGLYPYDGTAVHDPGYISNSILKHWPNSDFIIGATIGGTATPLLDIAVSATTPTVTLKQAAGPLYVNAGQVYLDASNNGGIGETSGGHVVVGAGGIDVLTFIPGGTPSATFSSGTGSLYVLGAALYLDASNHCGITETSGNLVLTATGGLVLTAQNIEVDGGTVWLDSAHHYGIAISGSNLELGATGGIVASASKIQSTLGYVSADGSDGGSGVVGASGGVGGATFKNGLYISGDFSGGSGGTGVTEAPTDGTYYTRKSAAWHSFSEAINGYVGAASITTLGTITTGTWNATAINLASYATGILPSASFPALTGDVTTTAGSVATTIGTGKVTNAMLAGSIAASKLVGTDIATVGTITSGTWHGSPIGDSYLVETYVTATELAAWTGSTNVVTLGTVVTGTWSASINTSSSATVGNLYSSAVSCTSITASGAVSVGAGLTVTGNVGCSGTFSAGSVATTGNATFGGTLGVTGNTTLTTLAVTTVTSGAWHGTAIADTYIASASTWNAKVSASDLASWSGSSNITTLGSISSCISLYMTGNATIRGDIGVDGTSYLNGIRCSKLFPATDSTSAVKICSTDNTVVLSVDTTNKRIGVGTSGPYCAFQVVGAIASDTLFTPSVYASNIQPNGADGTTALQIITRTSAVVCNFDTTNKRVGINNNSPAQALDVTGSIQASGTIATSAGYVRTTVLQGYSTTGAALEIKPGVDSTAGVTIANASDAAVCTFDTSNRIVYPYRLVIPAGS